MYQPLLLKCGVKNGLECYYYLKGKDPAKGLDFYLLDSGGYVARKQNVFIDVKEYADYLNRHKIKLAFNLDTNSVEETVKNQNFLRAYCPDTVIIPVYHMSDWIEKNGLLDQYIEEGYQYIALGGTAGVTNSKVALSQFYDHCFSKTRDKIKIHGLGQTTKSMLEKYPFYSVDSTSWLSMSRYGNSLKKDKDMVFMKAKSRHYMENTTEEIGHWLEYEKELTKVWQLRGVKWKDEFDYRNT